MSIYVFPTLHTQHPPPASDAPPSFALPSSSPQLDQTGERSPRHFSCHLRICGLENNPTV